MNVIDLNDFNGKNNKFSTLIKQMYLIRAELLTLRLDWKWSFLVVLLNPLGMLFFLYFIFQKNGDYQLYIITGNMVMSLVTGTMLTLGQELGLLKQIRGFDYYATLPIRKIFLITAFITRSTLTTIPSMLILLLAGRFLLNINIIFHPSLIIVLLLSGYSLSALGGFIGLYSRDVNQASMMTQIIQPIIVYVAPVFIPIEYMPKTINLISYIIPTKYVAQALRASCIGVFDYKSIIILLLFCIVSVILIEFKMDWRN